MSGIVYKLLFIYRWLMSAISLFNQNRFSTNGNHCLV